MKGVPRYIEKHGLDPSDMICEAHMSDDASDASDSEEPGESHEQWKRRMATEVGLDGKNLSAKQLDKMRFRETIQPGWRSKQLTNIFRELHDLWWESLSTQRQEAIGAFVVRTDRWHESRVPIVAPFDLGIDLEWWNQNKDSYGPSILKDWFMYGNPEGFESEAAPASERSDSPGLRRTESLDSASSRAVFEEASQANAELASTTD
ncbi:hypothetical protein PLICRDRAFT_47149 [Plicaturopsis crispa FD-325 SS-3]|uniref:Uncharacterized protein n=1 Tax=Plicaturopsis crispa FD-325 SS-3 TaxID=944288 RepID=A0A0C9SWF8_PLICR|nr:hypothetical protein PLICRDRAFT_47149 [Plicaturopsis crispa FD-325 SS-3]